MQEGAASTQKPISPAKAKILRARSLPSRKPFDVAVIFSMIHYFGIVITVTALVCYLMEPSQLASKFVAGGLVFCALSWLIAFFKRRAAFCPLCKGTPLMNSGAHTHVKATRIVPFNHGTSALLAIIANQKFRCMYCGSDYDLLKPPSHLLVGGKAAEEVIYNYRQENDG